MATKFLFEDDETAPISMLLKKSYNEALNKIVDIVEIIMVMLNCSYLDAFIIVVRSSTGKAILEGDMATMYQSAACCIEDIGREISKSKYAKYFSDECISRAINSIRYNNEQNRLRYKKTVI